MAEVIITVIAPLFISDPSHYPANKQGAGGQVSLTSKMWQKFTRPLESNSLNLNLKLVLLKVVKYISQSLAEKFWAG